MDEIKNKNQLRFEAIKKLNLPLGQYAITGSGALGIRNLREINDIDLIVTLELWKSLAATYGVTDTNSVEKITFPKEAIEAFREGSFYAAPKDEDAPTVAERIAKAEVIDGLPFESLEHVLYYKQKMGREKDLKDVQAIEEWLKSSS